MNEVRRPVEILLVDDNPADTRLMQEAFREGKVMKHLTSVSDGVEALNFLKQTGEYTHAPRPDLIILDLNLPRKDGRKVLQEIKLDPNLKRIPVMVLTTSRAEQDLQQVYDLHANCYITKPVHLENFLDVVRAIEQFWFNIASLPS